LSTSDADANSRSTLGPSSFLARNLSNAAVVIAKPSGTSMPLARSVARRAILGPTSASLFSVSSLSHRSIVFSLDCVSIAMR
jgi:hypothetical protein